MEVVFSRITLSFSRSCPAQSNPGFGFKKLREVQNQEGFRVIGRLIEIQLMSSGRKGFEKKRKRPLKWIPDDKGHVFEGSSSFIGYLHFDSKPEINTANVASG
jgi:hypothetical protein